MALSGKQRVQQLFFNTTEQQFHSGRDLPVFNVIGRLTGVSSHGVAKAAAGWQALECCLAVLHGEWQKADKDLPGLCPLVMARMAIFKCFSAAIVRKLQMAGLAAHLCFWEKVPFLNSRWGCHWVCCVKGSARFTTDVPTAEEENGISVATSLPKILAAEASETVHVNIPVLALQKNLRQSLKQFVTEGFLVCRDQTCQQWKRRQQAFCDLQMCQCPGSPVPIDSLCLPAGQQYHSPVPLPFSPIHLLLSLLHLCFSEDGL